MNSQGRGITLFEKKKKRRKSLTQRKFVISMKVKRLHSYIPAIQTESFLKFHDFHDRGTHDPTPTIHHPLARPYPSPVAFI